jgi:hypothetical protein
LTLVDSIYETIEKANYKDYVGCCDNVSVHSATFSGRCNSKKSEAEKRRVSRRQSMLELAYEVDDTSIDGPIIGGNLIEIEGKEQWSPMRQQRTILPTSKRTLQTQESRHFSKNAEVISDLMYTLTVQNQKVLAPRDQEVILNTFGRIILGHAGIVVHAPSQGGSTNKIKQDRSSGVAYLESIQRETRMINWQSIKNSEKSIPAPNLINNFNEKYMENIVQAKRRENFGKLNIAEAIVKFSKDALAQKHKEA